MLDDVCERAGDELAPERLAVIRQHAQVDVDRAARDQRLERARLGSALLVDHRRERDLDAVSRDPSDHEVAIGPERDLTVLLRLPVGLATRRDGTVRLEHEERRVGPARAVRQAHRQLEGRLAVGAEPLGVAHPVDVRDHEIVGERERLGNELIGRLAVGPVDDREDLRLTHADRQRRRQRRAVRGRGEVARIERHASSGATQPYALQPPSTRSVAPVTNEASSSLARNSAARAISSGSPKRRCGVRR